MAQIVDELEGLFGDDTPEEAMEKSAAGDSSGGQADEEESGILFWHDPVKNTELELKQKVTEYQIQLLTGSVPPDKLMVIQYKGGGGFVYLPTSLYIDMLNKIFGLGKWKCIVDKRSMEQVPVTNKWECRVEGRLIIPDYDIEIWADGGQILKVKETTKVSDGYKAAKSDMLKVACTSGLGFALDLKDKKFQEQALVQYGAAKPPGSMMNNLKVYLPGVKTDVQILTKLREKGIEVEDWELKSEERVIRLIALAKSKR